jgi:hypothetical protein
MKTEIRAVMKDRELRDALIEAFQQLKSQSNAIGSLRAEVCAVRDSLIEIGPKYADVLKRQRESHIQSSKLLVAGDLHRLDEIVRKLKDG